MTHPITIARPVIRSDGAYYRDISDAALAALKEGRAGTYDSAYTNIKRVCDGEIGRVTSGGYGWRWANEEDAEIFKAERRARREEIRRRKVEALKADTEAPIATDLIGRALKECGMKDNTCGYYELLVQLGQLRTRNIRRANAGIKSIQRDDWIGEDE